MSTALLDQSAPVDDATRRQFLAGAAAAALLAGCGNDSSTSEGSAGPMGWSFTDDRGETITLPARPQRIAMQEDAAGALLSFGIRPIAVFGNDLISESPQFEGIDITGIEQLGAEYGVIDLEKLAALDPDLIIVPLYPDLLGGFQDRAQSDLAAQIAPIVAISVAGTSYSELIGRFAQLAGALGADLDAPELVRMRADFDAAKTELRTAATQVPGLRVLATSPTEELVYVLSPGQDSELAEYEAAGLEILSVGDPAVFTEVSWERISEQPADVILLDGRSFVDDGLDFLDTHPIWPTLPAVQAGQVGSWFVGTMYRMPFFTQQLRDLAALIERSRVVHPGRES